MFPRSAASPPLASLFAIAPAAADTPADALDPAAAKLDADKELEPNGGADEP